MTNITFRNASNSDWPQIAELLTQAQLPPDGAQDHLKHFVLAFKGETLIGCAGLEVYSEYGLLRSVAVAAEERGQGLGIKLVRRALAQAKTYQLREIILLTETAANFFPKFGFRFIKREEAPTPVRESVEFKGACPDSAAVMRLAW